jgi:hypothetical protein
MQNGKLLILALLFAFALSHGTRGAHAAVSSGVSGLGDDTVHQALAEEFVKCSAFCGIAADCAQKNARKQSEKSPVKRGQNEKEPSAAKDEDLAKRFYKGSYMLAGQDFTQRRIRFHDTDMRRRGGNACEGFPKLEQQYRKLCDDTFRRLPRTLQ